MSDHEQQEEFDESALLEESGGEDQIETETNETGADEENDPVSDPQVKTKSQKNGCQHVIPEFLTKNLKKKVTVNIDIKNDTKEPFLRVYSDSCR
jgi:hypothetical protein